MLRFKQICYTGDLGVLDSLEIVAEFEFDAPDGAAAVEEARRHAGDSKYELFFKDLGYSKEQISEIFAQVSEAEGR